MGLTRSTFYAEPQVQPIRLVEQIKAVCAEWPAYGYRRVTAELHGEGRIVNHKKVMRSVVAMNRRRGRTVRPFSFISHGELSAIQSANGSMRVWRLPPYDGPIFPNLAENVVPTDLNQLWVADITYIAIATGFVYLAAILDASITPIAVRSTRPKITARSSPSTASRVRWAVVATPMTMPRLRASLRRSKSRRST